MIENEHDWNMKVFFFLKTFILQRLIGKQFEQREWAASKFPITRTGTETWENVWNT